MQRFFYMATWCHCFGVITVEGPWWSNTAYLMMSLVNKEKGRARGPSIPPESMIQRLTFLTLGPNSWRFHHFQIVWQADTQALHVWSFEEHSIPKLQQKDWSRGSSRVSHVPRGLCCGRWSSWHRDGRWFAHYLCPGQVTLFQYLHPCAAAGSVMPMYLLSHFLCWDIFLSSNDSENNYVFTNGSCRALYS